MLKKNTRSLLSKFSFEDKNLPDNEIITFYYIAWLLFDKKITLIVVKALKI